MSDFFNEVSIEESKEEIENENIISNWDAISRLIESDRIELEKEQVPPPKQVVKIV